MIQRSWLAVTLLAFVFVFWHETEVEGSIYFRDHFFSCRGRSTYSDIYTDLSRVCDDCQNLSRDKSVYLRCRENCFVNELFLTCMEVLMIPDDVQQQYRNNVSIIREGRR
ncbi:crustacean hyperglycemic hormone-like [Oratosquilla oratoria]|uniref:crustacean hyperglycemic hormone-like n=1 Tax=Oratosquilla oratoria TaxID=337810 RepID=UPI003F762EC0